jgi:pimeloyl-ACP methyl ester carboxylesterase
MRIGDGGSGERKSSAPTRMMDPYGLEPKWVNLGPDGKLHLLRAPGPQPTWILLPALGTPASTWVSILRPISEEQEGFAVDLPGFGVSTSPKDVPTFHDHVATVMKLLDVLEAPQYVLIGSSTCAMIAAEIARRSPGRVRALIVLGFGRVQDPGAWWARVGGSSEEPSRVLDEAYYHPPSLSPALRQLLADTFNAPAYHTFLDEPALAAMPTIFDGIEVPTLFISGEDDMIMPVAAVTDAAARVPGARVELVARCGHFPHLERSQEVLSIVRAFLDQLPKV